MSDGVAGKKMVAARKARVMYPCNDCCVRAVLGRCQEWCEDYAEYVGSVGANGADKRDAGEDGWK